MTLRTACGPLFFLLCFSSRGCGGEQSATQQQQQQQPYVRRVDSPWLYYAAESRNYPEEPDLLFVTARGGGLTAFNISGPAQFDAVARWETDAAVEGQDRVGDLMVVSELGRGPSGPFPGSSGPKLHFFRLGGGGGGGATSPAALQPFASLDLSPFIDGILHVKFLQPSANEWWAACSGGFATSVEGALVLVNVTRAVQQQQQQGSARAAEGAAAAAGGGGGGTAAVTLRSDEVTVLSTPVLQPEGVMVVVAAAAAPAAEEEEEEEGRRLLVYIGGINSTSLGVVDATAFSSPLLLEARPGVGEQLVGARRSDQPRWNPASVSAAGEENADDDDDDDDGLVFMAGWGEQGRLVVLDASGDKAAAPVLVAQTAPRDSRSLAMANRVKLVFAAPAPPSGGGGGLPVTVGHHRQKHDEMKKKKQQQVEEVEEAAYSNSYDVALVPLEQPRGGFAAVDLSGVAQAAASAASSTSSEPDSLRTLEAVHVPLSEFARSGGATTKAYCLAVSSTRHVYLFIAETSAVFIYCLDSALGRGSSCGSGGGV